MKAGLVRIASCSALALAVVGLSACNDDPLTFDTKTGTRLFTNPSAMVLNGGGTQRLVVNVLNDGFEPTFDVPSLTEGTSAECSVTVTGDVLFRELPAATSGGSSIANPIDSVLATGAEPPNKYDVVGVGIGDACLIGSFGSLSEEIPVTVVPFGFIIAGPNLIADGDFTIQTYTVEAIDADSSINSTWDITAPYVTVSTSDTLIAEVVDVISPNTVELRRGPLGGDVLLTVTTDQNGVIRTESDLIVVEKSTPVINSVSPPSGGAGDTVTITGVNLSILPFGGDPTIVSVGGLGLDFALANVISESTVQLVVVMPSFGTLGDYPITVDVDGVTGTATLDWNQASDFDPDGCELGVIDCTIPGVFQISVPFVFNHLMPAPATDNYFTFGVSRDMDIQFDLDWVDPAQDVDLYIVDGAFTAFVCTDGATGAKPEQSNCHTEDPGDYIFWVDLYSGPTGITYTASAKVINFR